MDSELEPGLRGDPSGVAALYVQEWSSLLRLAYLLTNSRSIAEEVVQEAFARLQATTTRVVNPGAFLRTIVANASRDVLRHQAVVERTTMPTAQPALSEPDELFDVLARLPWRQQAALVLRFHLDLAEPEIAAALGCRPSTVRSIIRRALGTLRRELSA